MFCPSSKSMTGTSAYSAVHGTLVGISCSPVLFFDFSAACLVSALAISSLPQYITTSHDSATTMYMIFFVFTSNLTLLLINRNCYSTLFTFHAHIRFLFFLVIKVLVIQSWYMARIPLHICLIIVH